MVIQGSKRIYKLDLLKGAACVGVVFTHVTFPGLWGKAVMRAAGFAVHLWYLIAMAENYGLWLFISKHRWQQMAVRCLPVLFLLQFLPVIYCDTYDLPWALQVNFLLRALPWFLLGHEIRAGEKQMVEMPEKGRMAELLKNDRMLCGLAFVGLLIAVLPSVFDLPLKFNAIGYVPYSAALFLLAIKKPDRRTSRLLEYIGGRLSMYVYVLHVLMAGAAKELMMRLLGAEFLLTSAYEWTWPLATLMISRDGLAYTEVIVHVGMETGEGETSIKADIEILGELSDEDRDRIIEETRSCPVCNILRSNIVLDI